MTSGSPRRRSLIAGRCRPRQLGNTAFRLGVGYFSTSSGTSPDPHPGRIRPTKATGSRLRTGSGKSPETERSCKRPALLVRQPVSRARRRGRRTRDSSHPLVRCPNQSEAPRDITRESTLANVSWASERRHVENRSCNMTALPMASTRVCGEAILALAPRGVAKLEPAFAASVRRR